MKKFRFTLQALQTLRQRQERLALEEYARAVQGRAHAMAELAGANRDLEAGWGWLRQQTTASATAEFVRHLQTYCQAVEERRRKCQDEVQTAHKIFQQAWQTLLAARRQREAVDKYLERRKQSYDREIQRAEQRELDDMARRRVNAAGIEAEDNPELALN